MAVYSWFTMIYPFKMVIFQFAMLVYQRVACKLLQSLQKTTFRVSQKRRCSLGFRWYQLRLLAQPPQTNSMLHTGRDFAFWGGWNITWNDQTYKLGLMMLWRYTHKYINHVTSHCPHSIPFPSIPFPSVPFPLISIPIDFHSHWFPFPSNCVTLHLSIYIYTYSIRFVNISGNSDIHSITKPGKNKHPKTLVEPPFPIALGIPQVEKSCTLHLGKTQAFMPGILDEGRSF